MQKQPLILTLKIDEISQAFFNLQRQQYFPQERNYLNAHLMLFHQLPDSESTIEFLSKVAFHPFTAQVTGLMNLGAGVAYRVESPELKSLHQLLYQHFLEFLIPQDRQGFRPHITVMNKTTPESALNLIEKLSGDFNPFQVKILGFELWTYLDGPWQHNRTIHFVERLLDNNL